MILELDVGNTRLKWRCIVDSLVDGPQIDAGFLVRAEYESCALCLSALGRLLEDRQLSSIVQVRVASVAASEHAALLSQWCQGEFSVTPEFAVVTAEAAGVTNGYESVGRLGVDRWLAILAAQQLSPSGFCVVDCGSAITVDIVVEGRHKGGYIVPGFRLMNSALFSETDGVKVEPDFNALSSGFCSGFTLGGNTEQAVGYGLPMMVTGLIQESLTRARRVWGLGGQLILTGGDADIIMPLLDEEHVSVYKPDLVLDGLALAQLRT